MQSGRDRDPLDPRAGLAAVRERAPEGALDGALEIGVVEDEHRVLAPELEHDRAQAVGRGPRDAPADLDRAGEHDRRDPAMADERLADLAAALDDAHQAGRRTGPPEQLLDESAGERRQLRGLHDRGVPRGDRRRNLPERDRERVVPGRHDPDHAERLIAQRAALLAQDELREADTLLAQHPSEIVGMPSARVRRDDEVVGVRLGQWLPRLERDGACNRIGVLDERVDHPPKKRAAAFEGLACERRLGQPRLGDDLRQLLGRRDLDVPERLERRRVDGDQLADRDVRPGAHGRIVAPAARGDRLSSSRSSPVDHASRSCVRT